MTIDTAFGCISEGHDSASYRLQFQPPVANTSATTPASDGEESP